MAEELKHTCSKCGSQFSDDDIVREYEGDWEDEDGTVMAGWDYDVCPNCGEISSFENRPL